MDGLGKIPQLREIVEIFTNAPTDHFITHFGFTEKPVTWNTQVFFAGRYVFTYQTDVVIDYKARRIREILAKPKFYLVEVAEVFDASPVNIAAKMGRGYNFGEEDWNKVIAAKGDFSVIGIHLATNNPVPRFEDYVRTSRRDRIQFQPVKRHHL